MKLRLRARIYLRRFGKFSDQPDYKKQMKMRRRELAKVSHG